MSISRINAGQVMPRRDFLKTLGAGAAVAVLPGQLSAEEKVGALSKPEINVSKAEVIPHSERTTLSKTYEGLVQYGQRRLVIKTEKDFSLKEEFERYLSHMESRYKALGHDGFNTYIVNLDRLRNNEPQILNDTDVDLYNRTTDMLLPPKFLAKLQTEVERRVDVNNINQRADAYMVNMKQRPFVLFRKTEVGRIEKIATLNNIIVLPISLDLRIQEMERVRTKNGLVGQDENGPKILADNIEWFASKNTDSFFENLNDNGVEITKKMILDVFINNPELMRTHGALNVIRSAAENKGEFASYHGSEAKLIIGYFNKFNALKIK